MKLNILIVEDDPLFGVELEMLLKEIGYDSFERVDNSAEAIEYCITNKPDFIIMDIDIKGRLTGLEVGKKIKHLDLPILYITSFDDDAHYSEAVQSNMVGYLVKPLSKFSLLSSINLAIQSLKNKTPNKVSQIKHEFILDNYFFFKKKDLYIKTHIKNIAFIEANGDYVNVYLSSGDKFMTRIKLSDIEKELPYDKFMRVHRSYIVQLEKIESVNFASSILNINDNKIPMNKSNKDRINHIIRKMS